VLLPQAPPEGTPRICGSKFIDPSCGPLFCTFCRVIGGPKRDTDRRILDFTATHGDHLGPVIRSGCLVGSRRGLHLTTVATGFSMLSYAAGGRICLTNCFISYNVRDVAAL
jgi:hypothetical protein